MQGGQAEERIYWGLIALVGRTVRISWGRSCQYAGHASFRQGVMAPKGSTSNKYAVELVPPFEK